ncbi:MAG: rhodanese-like domain-containing protein [Desulfovibrio sp.]
MRKPKVWRYFILEAVALLLLSALLGLGVNHFRADGLRLDGKSTQQKSEPATSPQITFVTPAEAMQLASDTEALFVDVRDSLEYADGHISGAVHLPYSAVRDNPDPLRIILYCSGPECTMAENYAHHLLEDGIQILVMPQGISGWFAAGGLVEAGK